MGKWIRGERVEILRRAYLRGDRAAIAACAANVSSVSANNWFRKFRRQGLTRGVVVRKPIAQGRIQCAPVYDGPIWIGKRIAPGA